MALHHGKGTKWYNYFNAFISELIIRRSRRKPWVLESVFFFLLNYQGRIFFTTEEAIIEAGGL